MKPTKLKLITNKAIAIRNHELHGNLSLIETDYWLHIKPVDWKEWERDREDMEDSFDQEMEILAGSQFSPCCNGWDLINPESIGALTEGILLSKESSEDDDGNILSVGRVYWQEDYALRSLINQIDQWGYASLLAVD